MNIMLQLTDEIFHKMPMEFSITDNNRYVLKMDEDDLKHLIQNNNFLNGNVNEIYSFFTKAEEIYAKNPKMKEEANLKIDYDGLCIINFSTKDIIIISNENNNWHYELQDLWIKTIDNEQLENAYIKKFIKNTNEKEWDNINDLFVNKRIIGILKNNETYKTKRIKVKIPQLNEYLTKSIYSIIRVMRFNNEINNKQYKKLKQNCFKKQYYKIDFSPFKVTTYYIDKYDGLSRALMKRSVINNLEKIGIKFDSNEKEQFLTN